MSDANFASIGIFRSHVELTSLLLLEMDKVYKERKTVYKITSHIYDFEFYFVIIAVTLLDSFHFPRDWPSFPRYLTKANNIKAVQKRNDITSDFFNLCVT